MTLNATVGAADANSYVTVEEADEYFDNRVHSEAWDTVSDAASALVTASLQLDWYLDWKGSKATDTQSMGWPRSGVVINNYTPSYSFSYLFDYYAYMSNNTYPSNVIPVEVKVAVFELALSSISEDRTDDFALSGLKIVKAGSIMVEADNSVGNQKPQAIPLKVKRILKNFLSKPAGIVWLMRA